MLDDLVLVFEGAAVSSPPCGTALRPRQDKKTPSPESGTPSRLCPCDGDVLRKGEARRWPGPRTRRASWRYRPRAASPPDGGLRFRERRSGSLTTLFRQSRKKVRPKVWRGILVGPSPTSASRPGPRRPVPQGKRETRDQYRQCGRQESNLHGLPHGNLNPARLPVPPRPLHSCPPSRPRGQTADPRCCRPTAPAATQPGPFPPILDHERQPSLRPAHRPLVRQNRPRGGLHSRRVEQAHDRDGVRGRAGDDAAKPRGRK